MINLIPPSAKQAVVKEYWRRVGVTWVLLLAVAFLIGTAMLLPPYVLINSQVAAHSNTASEAATKIENYDAVVAELRQASRLAFWLEDAAAVSSLHYYVARVHALAQGGITITNIQIRRTADQSIDMISITGQADDRRSLAAYRDRLLEESSVAQVDLPLSNLASDRDIQFSLTVSLVDDEPAASS